MATLKSITLATLLKTMGWHEERQANAGAGEAQDAGETQDAGGPG